MMDGWWVDKKCFEGQITSPQELAVLIWFYCETKQLFVGFWKCPQAVL